MDGTADPKFVVGSGFDNNVFAMAIQINGKVIVGGHFTTYKGVACPTRLVRLNLDGSLDTTFNNGGGTRGFNGLVDSIAIQPDGKIIVGGNGFSTYNGVAVLLI